MWGYVMLLLNPKRGESSTTQSLITAPPTSGMRKADMKGGLHVSVCVSV